MNRAPPSPAYARPGYDPRNHTPRPQYQRPERDPFAITTDQRNAAEALLRGSSLKLVRP